MKYFTSSLTALSVIASVAAVTVPATVSATKKKANGDHKVTICHRTNSVKNPYVQITVDYAAVDGHKKNDHSHHDGPVPTSEAHAESLKQDKIKWGDIIPPVQGVNPGQNWDSVGQSVYNNGCELPKVLASTDDDNDNGKDNDEVIARGGGNPAGGKTSGVSTEVENGDALAKTGTPAMLSSIAAVLITGSVGFVNYLTQRSKLQ